MVAAAAPLLASLATTAGTAGTATAATVGSAAAVGGSAALLAAPAVSAAGFSATTVGAGLSLGSAATALSIGSGLFGAYSSIRSGQYASAAYNQEAKQLNLQADYERTRAAQEEANRQAELNRILGLQMASTAGRGIAIGSGSDVTISDFSEEEARRESGIATLDSKYQQTRLRSQASQSRTSGKTSLMDGYLQAGSTLFDTSTKEFERRSTTK